MTLDPQTDGLSRARDWAATAAMPQWLGLEIREQADGRRYLLHFTEQHLGNVMIRALHGGVISGFLQAATEAECRVLMPSGSARIISVHCDFLRAAHDRDMHARVDVLQRGRRVIFLQATGWQETEEKPVARAAIAARLLGEPGP